MNGTPLSEVVTAGMCAECPLISHLSLVERMPHYESRKEKERRVMAGVRYDLIYKDWNEKII